MHDTSGSLHLCHVLLHVRIDYIVITICYYYDKNDKICGTLNNIFIGVMECVCIFYMDS